MWEQVDATAEMYRPDPDGGPGMRAVLHAQALVNMAVCASRLGLRETAQRLYARALDEAPSANPHLAGATLVRQASLSYNGGHYQRADDLYTAALDEFRKDDHIFATISYEVAGALINRADSRRELNNPDGAIEDLQEAFKLIDQGRLVVRYQSVRTADSVLFSELSNALKALISISIEAPEVLSRHVVGIFLRASNSSVAAAIRSPGVATQDARRIYLSSGSKRARLVAELAHGWTPVSDEDIDRASRPRDPTLLLWTTGGRGCTVLVQSNHDPVVHAGRLKATTISVSSSLPSLSPRLHQASQSQHGQSRGETRDSTTSPGAYCR